jgi:cobalt-zinc-cadmium efflux system outer membrane protein
MHFHWARRSRSVVVLLLSLLAVVREARGEDPPAEMPADSPAEPRGVLVLADAIALALARNPELQAFSLGLRAEEAQRTQAALRPNPELDIELENFGGTLPGVDESELTLSIGQVVELGGKRKARIESADGRAAVARVDYEALRLVVIAEVAERFIEAVGVERGIVLADAALRTIAETDSVVGLRVTAGAASRADKARAEAELARMRLERETLVGEAAIARSRLAVMWGATEPSFTALGGDLDSLPQILPLDELLARARQGPDVARWDAEVLARESQIRMERSLASTDLDLSAGYRHLAGTDDNTFVAGLGFALPIFARNQGNVAAAQAAADQARTELARAALERSAEIARSHLALAREEARIRTLREEVLPKTERAFQEMRAGFERGRFSYLDLLEARRSWIETRREELVSLVEFHKVRVGLERLVGGPANPQTMEGPR